MKSLVQFRRIALTTDTWKPIAINTHAQQVDKAWLEFSDDVKFRSDSSDENTEYVAQAAVGKQFLIPCGSLAGSSYALIFYAQSVNGDQTVVLTWSEK